MELKNYWRLVMTNGQEFFVQSPIDERETFLKALVGRGIFTAGNGYITLQQNEKTDPIDIKEDKLFSVQKSGEAMIGAQTRIWRLV